TGSHRGEHWAAPFGHRILGRRSLWARSGGIHELVRAGCCPALPLSDERGLLPRFEPRRFTFGGSQKGVVVSEPEVLLFDPQGVSAVRKRVPDLQQFFRGYR